MGPVMGPQGAPAFARRDKGRRPSPRGSGPGCDMPSIVHSAGEGPHHRAIGLGALGVDHGHRVHHGVRLVEVILAHPRGPLWRAKVEWESRLLPQQPWTGAARRSHASTPRPHLQGKSPDRPDDSATPTARQIALQTTLGLARLVPSPDPLPS